MSQGTPSVTPPSARARELDALVRHHNLRYWDDATPEISDVAYDALTLSLIHI